MSRGRRSGYPRWHIGLNDGHAVRRGDGPAGWGWLGLGGARYLHLAIAVLASRHRCAIMPRGKIRWEGPSHRWAELVASSPTPSPQNVTQMGGQAGALVRRLVRTANYRATTAQLPRPARRRNVARNRAPGSQIEGAGPWHTISCQRAAAIHLCTAGLRRAFHAGTRGLSAMSLPRFVGSFRSRSHPGARRPAP
ncbi:hypothetical protein EJ06DRAFT_38885 [Trichodelitschia bisporula]|uniref:Uncharacterized protein n=1 Tax=Trichodelitschia bisporula TaxID=703511 RepID=A0A6G1HV24_9PEZI|nr:hypothetical protein EJ06DRAFT_38885 [Trichodelitschia bisporula]